MLQIRRVREDARDELQRTVGLYTVFLDGIHTNLSGWIAECGGPGDNTHAGNHQRIEIGTYRLQRHDGTRYRTIGYVAYGKGYPRPAIELADTGHRKAILLHPGHGFLSSIGCLNPCTDLTLPNMDIDYYDSKMHTIRLLNHIKSCFGNHIFAGSGPLSNATIQISENI